MSLQRWLVVDLGGTNMRLALAEPGADGQPRLLHLQSHAAAGFASAAEACRAYLDSCGATVRHALLCVAGRVRGRRVQMTNLPWLVDADALQRELGLERVALLNDLAAAAHALPLLQEDEAPLLWPCANADAAAPAARRRHAVVGAGTGLGIALALVEDGHVQVLDTEGGQAAYAPENEEEAAVAQALRRRFDRVSWERVASGPGLAHLYAALADDGAAGDGCAPEEIVRRAREGHDARAERALRLFAQALAAVAGDAALMLGAWDGVYLVGGLPQATRAWLADPAFRARFAAKGSFSQALAEVPVRLVTHAQPVLLGAARVALAGGREEGTRRRGALASPPPPLRMSPMPATIKDVARAAGVSVATVSRALNGADNVLPDTRERILQLARELRYAPSGAARSLITRRTDTIGALLPDLHGEFFSELIRGIDQAARARGLHLLLSSSHGDAEEAAAALRAMNGRVDGLLVMSPHADEDEDFLARNLPAGLPTVLLNSGVSQTQHPAFVVDNFGGARAMTEHLVAQGFQRIAFLGGPAGNWEARERLRGYRDGLPPGRRALLLDGDFSEDGGRRAGRALALQQPPERPDVLFCANDIMAVGALQALTDAGLRVPEDIALAGFDDIPIARYVRPALTTVRVPIAALGGQALVALAAELDTGSDTDTHTAPAVMPVALVVRESCTRRSP